MNLDAKTYVLILLLLSILGKESSGGRHCERLLRSESDALRLPVVRPEVDKGSSDFLSDTRDGGRRKTGPVRVLADEIRCVLWNRCLVTGREVPVG